MVKTANPRRYAQAIFELALEEKELDRWRDDLQKLAVAAGDADFLSVMENPKISLEEKERFLKETFAGINTLAVNMALLLVTRSDTGMIPAIASEYEKMLNKHRGIETAEVITAVPLDARDKEKLQARLGDLTGAKVELKTKVDPEILGGVIARVGGKLLDGSTRSKLAALKKELEGRG